MVRRQTLPEDLDRLADNLFINEGDFISDRDSFDLSLQRYLVDEGLSDESKDKVFEKFKKIKPTVSEDRIFKKAGGKSLSRDRRQTAKTVTKDREEFIRKGSRRIDFAGLDIKESEIRKRQVGARKGFDVAARVKQKIVFAKKETIRIKGKSFVRHRDKLGRFASVK